MTNMYVLVMFSFIFLENRMQHLMQIGDNFAWVPHPIFWKENKKKIQMLSAENFTQSAMH